MTEAVEIFNVHKKDKKLFAGFVPPTDKGETFANIFANQFDSIINKRNFTKISKKIGEKDVVNLAEEPAPVVNSTEEKEDEVMDPGNDTVESHDAEMTPVGGPILVPIVSDLFMEIDNFKTTMNAPAKSEIFQKIMDQKSWNGVKKQYIRVTLQYFLKLFKMEESDHEYFQVSPPSVFMFNHQGLFCKTIINSPRNGLYITSEAIRAFSPKRSDALGQFFIDFSKKVNLPEAPPLSSLDERKRALVLHMFDHFYNLCE